MDCSSTTTSVKNNPPYQHSYTSAKAVLASTPNLPYIVHFLALFHPHALQVIQNHPIWSVLLSSCMCAGASFTSADGTGCNLYQWSPTSGS